MNKIKLAITIGELQVINQFLEVIPCKKEPLGKALNSIVFKVSEKLRKRVIEKIHHQDRDITKITLEYPEGYALHEFFNEINYDFQNYPYETNILMKITEVIYQQL